MLQLVKFIINALYITIIIIFVKFCSILKQTKSWTPMDWPDPFIYTTRPTRPKSLMGWLCKRAGPSKPSLVHFPPYLGRLDLVSPKWVCPFVLFFLLFGQLALEITQIAYLFRKHYQTLVNLDHFQSQVSNFRVSYSNNLSVKSVKLIRSKLLNIRSFYNNLLFLYKTFCTVKCLASQIQVSLWTRKKIDKLLDTSERTYFRILFIYMFSSVFIIYFIFFLIFIC